MPQVLICRWMNNLILQCCQHLQTAASHVRFQSQPPETIQQGNWPNKERSCKYIYFIGCHFVVSPIILLLHQLSVLSLPSSLSNRTSCPYISVTCASKNQNYALTSLYYVYYKWCFNSTAALWTWLEMCKKLNGSQAIGSPHYLTFCACNLIVWTSFQKIILSMKFSQGLVLFRMLSIGPIFSILLCDLVSSKVIVIPTIILAC